MCEVIERAQAWLDSPLTPDEQLLLGLTNRPTRKDCISVFWAVARTDGWFVDAYKEYVREHDLGDVYVSHVAFVVPSHVIDALDAPPFQDILERRPRFVGLRRTDDGTGYTFSLS